MLIFLNNKGENMSAFLGPIHFWLYNKVKIQNDLVEETIRVAEENNLHMRENLYGRFGDGELKSLEEVIDVNNIHGWLQEQVSSVEGKLAHGVTEIFSQKPELVEEIKTLFRNKGIENSALREDSSLEEIFKALNDTLLDGMPCDRANAVISQDENEVVWVRNLCVHEEYWNEAGGDIKNYYMLRDEFIKGLLQKAKVNYEKINDTTYKISR